MPQLDLNDFAPQLIWLAISFVALYIFMARLALPRIANILEERRDRITRDLDEAERLKAETEEAIASYEQALAEARGKAHTIAQETRNTLAEEVDEERKAVDEKLAEMTETAEARIEETKSAALSQIADVAGETVGAIVNQLIGTSVPKTEIDQAVSDAISRK